MAKNRKNITLDIDTVSIIDNWKKNHNCKSYGEAIRTIERERWSLKPLKKNEKWI